MLNDDRLYMVYEMGGESDDNLEVSLTSQYYTTEKAFEKYISSIMNSDYYTEASEEDGFVKKMLSGFQRFVEKVSNGIKDVFSRFRKSMPEDKRNAYEKITGRILVHNYADRLEIQTLANKVDVLYAQVDAKISSGAVTNPKEFIDKSVDQLTKIRKKVESLGKDTKVFAKESLNYDRDAAVMLENIYEVTKKSIQVSRKSVRKNKNQYTPTELEIVREGKRLASEYLRTMQAFIKRLNQNAAEIIKAMKAVKMA